jgi:osmoprotectant transport system permease protein
VTRARAARIAAAALVATALGAPPGCARAGDGATTVIVGSKAFTESVILGDMAADLARARGANADHRRQLGGTEVLFHALSSGAIDAYPEYTGTLYEEILRAETPGRDPALLRAALARRGLAMTASLGFDNTYALAMTEARAAALGVRRISDLAAHPELRLGLSNELIARGDGWPGLRARYGLPQAARGLDHDLAYRALASGGIDVTDVYATDAEIRAYHLRVLEDDRHQFPAYDVVLLYREALRARAPAVVAAWTSLEGRISAADMVRMNAEVKLDHAPEAAVASAFLASALGVHGAVAGESWARALGHRAAEHFVLVAVSLLAGIAIAVPLGVLASRRPRAGRVLIGVAGILQTIPSLALLVLLIPLFGIGSPPALVALFLYALLPILRNTHAGLEAIPEPLRESARAMGLTPGAQLRLVELPLAMPSIVAGVKTAAVIDVGTATVGALIGAGGFGQPILTGIRLDDFGLILQGAVPAALMAVAVERLFEAVERRVVPRGLRRRDPGRV